MLTSIIVAIILSFSSLPSVSSHSGDLTFYGGAGNGGYCSQNYVPSGYKTVAMNKPQYKDGLACGSCLKGCYNKNGQKVCFNAIVDNLCPECRFGDLDMGESGDGRWDVEWTYIDCPKAELRFSTQGSNGWYGKIKVEGGGPVAAMKVNGKETKSTPDAFWVVDDGSGKLGCGPKVTVDFANGKRVEKCLPGSLFGGGCSGGGERCTESFDVDGGDSNSSDELKPSSLFSDNDDGSKETPTAGPDCANGILHSDGISCCPKSCGRCGGSKCSSLPGGAHQCCASQIKTRHNRPCKSNSAPCTIN